MTRVTAMARERLYLFDTTLRDGAQTSGVDFTLADKLAIAKLLDELGIDYVEGGYPGANPTDTALFAEDRKLKTAAFTAFGMTRRPGRSASNDPGLVSLLDAKADAICFVAKSWDYQVRVALETTLEENLASIRDSVQAAKAKGREVLAEWPGEAIRLAMLQTHYRQPINWTTTGLAEAKRTLDHWYQLTGNAAPGMLCADVVDALADDLNTPKALAALHELRGEAAKGPAGAVASLKASAQMMGLLQHSADAWAAWRPASFAIDDAKVDSLVAARNAARKARNFKEADRIRDELAAQGIELEDKKDGTTTWRVKR